MKISKSRIRQIISESLNKILNEEDKKEDKTSAEAGLKQIKPYQTGIGAKAALKMGIKDQVSDKDLKANYQVWKKNNQFYLISKKDPKFGKAWKKDASCQMFSITQKDIEDAKKGIKDAQKGKK